MAIFNPPPAAIVKVIAFFAAWTIFWLPVAIPLTILLNGRVANPLTVKQKLPIISSLYLVAPLIVGGASWVEGTSFSDYGLSWQPSILISLALGWGLSVFGIACVFAVEWLLGWIEWNPNNQQPLSSVWLPLLGLGLWIGITEELIFRGFLLNELSQDYSIWLATAISSAIFALLHLVWEQKEVVPQLPGLFLMGVVLVLARWVDDGSLGLAWGLHAGWVWGISCLDTTGLISYTGKGATWITGWGGQPLAGGAGMLCLLGTGAFLWVLWG